ncbi:hypothetical protein SAMN02927900_03410 [Rhizobium mongolense subsp. loessense]|uniref:Uncharacterized protein n=1 Tax=Rhizobium mongolense subsp. loessense TaxID=158890 RepID=A0A1G4S3V2_9HYPH|nr:hypothetical protein SAMN02927900_03410 [Rhizobium mongolense subsp. loessense]
MAATAPGGKTRRGQEKTILCNEAKASDMGFPLAVIAAAIAAIVLALMVLGDPADKTPSRVFVQQVLHHQVARSP